MELCCVFCGYFKFVRRFLFQLYMDWKLGSNVAIARSILDLIFFSGIVLKFPTTNLSTRKPNYSKSALIGDMIAILPLPQLIWPDIQFKLLHCRYDNNFLDCCFWTCSLWRFISQNAEVKEDRQRSRQRMVEEWMKYHQLPQPLKKKVIQAIQSEWSVTQGINNETILDTLPWDIRSVIRRHLYLDIIRTMRLFEDMDDDLVNAICGYLRTFSSIEGTYVVFEGEPVRKMLFVYSGQLEVVNPNNGGQCMILGPGDLCGKELLEWCSHPTKTTENLKPATQTIKCITDVDAFVLRVDDVKLLAIQFHRDGKFRRAFQRYAA